ncbi:phosphatase PAP2 family protein [Oleiharenicola lentus]|uniref:phosphatase PAP2 family protein n=1 Tax=Oleiharenicola lentus TaxID=2508720 RepID=UPI003F6662AC
MKSFFTLILFAALTLAAHAAHFLPADAIDVAKLLPPPPARDSLVQQSELSVLFALQQNRTPEQIKRALHIQEENLFTFTGEVVGPWFTPQNLPKTAALFKEAGDDFYAINRASKALWNRSRPPFVDPRIKPAVEFSDSPSYPSGHGIQCSMWAVLLSELFPEYKTALHARAADTRWYRLIAGAHYPTDVEAGRILGEAIANALLKDKNFRLRLEEARQEIAPFLQKKAA